MANIFDTIESWKKPCGKMCNKYTGIITVLHTCKHTHTLALAFRLITNNIVLFDIEEEE